MAESFSVCTQTMWEPFEITISCKTTELLDFSLDIL